VVLAVRTPAFLHEYLGTVSSLRIPADSVAAVVALGLALRHGSGYSDQSEKSSSAREVLCCFCYFLIRGLSHAKERCMEEIHLPVFIHRELIQRVRNAVV
jgi:hypothetical protein